MYSLTLTEQVLLNASHSSNYPVIRAIARLEPLVLTQWIPNILIFACENGSLPIVKLMVQLGADIHIGADRPLRRACEYKHNDIAEFLITQGADVTAKGHEPIQFAIIHYDMPLMDILIHAGAIIPDDALPNLGLIKEYHPEFLEYLMQNGHVARDADTSSPYGNLPF